MRERSYSYSPSPPRGYGRRHRSPVPRGSYGRGSEPPTSLLVRNLHRDCRPEDLRRPFGQFGPLKDIYLPRDYYTGEPRGFGFIQFVDPADAADAKYEMDGYILLGRELTVVFAEENRKKPSEMRFRELSRGGELMTEGNLQYAMILNHLVMVDLTPVALTIFLRDIGIIQGQFHLAVDRGGLTERGHTQGIGLLMVQGAGAGAHSPATVLILRLIREGSLLGNPFNA